MKKEVILIIAIGIVLIIVPGCFIRKEDSYQSYTWWTSPLFLEVENQLYFSYVDHQGNIWLHGNQHQVILDTFEVDDHNGAALGQLDDGRILTMYTRHNRDRFIHYKILKSKDMSVDVEGTAEASGKVTYIQLIHLKDNQYLVFYRVDLDTWVMRTYDASIDYFGEEIKLIQSSRNQYYMIAKKEYDKIHFMMTSHPVNAIDESLYYCYIKNDKVYNIENQLIGKIGQVLIPSPEFIVYETVDKTRLLDFQVKDGKIEWLFALFDKEDGMIYYGTNQDGLLIQPIASTGELLEKNKGKNYYIGGATFSGSDIIVAQYQDYGSRLLQYDKKNFSKKVLLTSNQVIQRPVVLKNRIYYLEGEYFSYSHFKTRIRYIDLD